MNERIVQDIKEWFDRYIQKFKSSDADWQRNIDLKEKHTRKVGKEILFIGEKLGLSNNALNLAEVIALLHDIGRFEQFATYNTFVDRDSADHAELSIKIIRENNILNKIDESIQGLILRTILYHNRLTLPQKETKKCLFFTKLLRDADKLDIWRVVIDYYNDKENGIQNDTIELGLPDTPGISYKVYKDLLERKTVKFINLKNLNDFKLLQIGWVYDINFLPTFQTIKNRHYLERIRNYIPKSMKINEIFDVVQSYMDEKIVNKKGLVV